MLTRPSLLVVDEIHYLPITRTGAMSCFQLMSRRYETASTVLTSNKGLEEWGTILGDEVMPPLLSTACFITATSSPSGATATVFVISATSGAHTTMSKRQPPPRHTLHLLERPLIEARHLTR